MVKSAKALIDGKGDFKTSINGLKKGRRDEFKAVVEYSHIEINGDEKLWTQ